MKPASDPDRSLAWVWLDRRFSEEVTGLRLDKSAAVGSAHVVGFLHLFCQPAHTPCRRHSQESQQYQGMERRRTDVDLRP
jgi:hypothetical protein